LVDENVTTDALPIARGLDPQIRMVTAGEAGLSHTPDPDIFAYAVENNMVIITGNIKDFRPLVLRWLHSGGEFAGIIYIKPEHQKNAALIAQKLVELAARDLSNLEVFI
jgi:predicted nuclease of predicted toxin-antitoxin system